MGDVAASNIPLVLHSPPEYWQPHGHYADGLNSMAHVTGMTYALSWLNLQD